MSFLAKIDRSKLALIGVVLAVTTFLAFNIFTNAALKGARLDLTEERLFTLSDGTRDILADIDEPITIRLFITKRLTELNPAHATYAARIRELLERYVDIGKGKIKVELYSPEPFTDEEDRAVSFGLQGVPLSNAGDQGYFGLVATNSTDDIKNIPYLSPERENFLEYDLTKLIYQLARQKKPRVALISALPVAGAMGPRSGQAPPWAVVDQVREFFEVVPVQPHEKSLPANTEMLWFVHPKGLSEPLTYAIDQFIMNGGRALVFVDPNSEIDVAMARGAEGAGVSDIDKLMTTWGVKMAPGKVLGDLDAARRVNVNVRGETTIADYVLWLSLLPKNFVGGDAITADFQRLTLASAGYLEPVEGAGTKFQPLIQSSPRAMGIDTAKVRVNPDVVALFRDFKPGGKPLTIAARITGPVKSAFPDGQPKDFDEEAKAMAPKGPHLAQSKSDVGIIVVADTDMLHEQFWMETRQLLGQTLNVPFANNGDLVVNSLENLSGGTALMSLRGRGEAFRPFTLVNAIRRDAELQYRTKETELEGQIKNLQQQLGELINREQAGRELVIGPEDRAKAEEYRREMIKLRRELREVQLSLRKDIDELDATLKFVNIALIPILLGVVAIVWTFVHRRRRARRFRVETA